MAGPPRPASGLPTRRTATRPTSRRLGSSMTTAERAASPAIASKVPSSSASRATKSPAEPASITAKRKERDFEREINEDTSIHVVVRCRGRNDREIKENSGVVVSTEGAKGKTVELSMGPNALANKTYTFDKVFSAAADQITVYEDVVIPIVNEMLAGYNCTIFAYGQTGTGKTYTMSGDMTDTLGILSDNAGIIPRVLYSLFHKLQDTESTVKCSFIELYNEELRDLLSVEENPRLKIFENESRKGHSGSTLVQGMEETFIDSASAGIKLLQEGSHKRHVAATKCNDLSSRSHTVFTITVMTKRTTESGDEYVSFGKLNLVDLAGSENIQRSGAENKRAAEAGLINKSLLTLGRVINALVDKSPHIPYRESKLTRLLQDSLGGKTKTCIIATISPSRSNLEETISTLDYAFRAKNIRNKPQINSTMPKKTLLREFTAEIEKLKGELIATRHRNGVYMSVDAWEEMTMESESRRIVSEEQRAKIESMESSLRHKVQELFSLTSNFNDLKKNNEETRNALKKTNDVLEQTEIVLKNTKSQLEEEEILRKAHEDTEAHLRDIGAGLLSTLDTTVEDINGLHAKIQRKTDLDSTNKEAWQMSAAEVTDVTQVVDSRLEDFQVQHSELVEAMSNKINEFVTTEIGNIELNKSQLLGANDLFDRAEREAQSQTCAAHDEMNEVLEEIKVLREEVKAKVGEGLNGLSAAAARISKEVIGEFADFNAQLHASYSTLGRDLKSVFENMVAHLNGQKTEINKLRLELQEANLRAVDANRKVSSHLAQTLEEENANAEAERDLLLSQVKSLIEESRQRQCSRLKGKIDTMRTDLSASGDSLEHATAHYDRQVDEWVFKSEQFAKDVTASKDEMKTKMQSDWEIFDQRNASIHKTTESVHEETVRIVDAQMKNMSKQMEALDDFVAKARSQNGLYRDAHLSSLQNMSSSVHQSYDSVNTQLSDLGGRLQELQEGAMQPQISLQESAIPLADDVRKPLLELRESIQRRAFAEYVATGTTPKKRHYDYPADLPRTEAHDNIKSRIRTSREFTALPFSGEEHISVLDSSPATTPAKGFVFHDTEDEVGSLPPKTTVTPSNTGLREVDANVVAKPLVPSTADDKATRKSSVVTVETECDDVEQPPPKRRCSSTTTSDAKLPKKLLSRKMAGIMEGPENVSPVETPSGRRLRRRPSP
ncbi:putative kinesin family protein (BimC) [Aspergillus homomorphus CBS 101889]|uniref:Kinesin-domain-containing protein n=1 Tax=Aspergillus homomorphus (strain CBS 101889) TaxID=1450537 RepID=A0A395HVQ6_ASPHC|nr:kinesin-domain-containing protein [Aspergillus homomorphus CBS 101889]RAL11897.1 kinesin-domain-containing protein [Aspergillus homomorphus CBS 101889]